ncbi:MAG: chorismate lyase [Azoarcus sp.]|nr:chorismate lyase [Azoarcus sp.]
MKAARPDAWRMHLHWQADNLVLRDWLRDRHSLTQRFSHCYRHFEVRCLAQGLKPLRPDEAACLGARPGQRAWTREVLLVCDALPVVFGHTVMLRHPRHSFDRGFHALGSRPLGGLLFSDPRIVRGPLEFRSLDARHPFYRRAIQALGAAALPSSLWARRSRFNHRAKGVLVTEVFLSAALPAAALPVNVFSVR